MGTAGSPNGVRNNGACAGTLAGFFARCGVFVNSPVPDIPITGLTDDSRQVAPGCCFVAVRGVGFDGHNFIDAAIRAGAAAVVVEREPQGCRNAVVVRVSDTRETIAQLAAGYYGLRDRGRNELIGVHSRGPQLVGVTGTNGKTTVTWLVRSILQAAGQPTALLGTVQYDLLSRSVAAPLTTPGPLELCCHLAEARDAGATHAVMEVSSHALHQRRCDGLDFAVGVFTNLTGDHLDYHGNMDAYFAAKRRLFEGLEASSTAVVNIDDSRGRELRHACRSRLITYSVDNPTADVWARVVSMDRRGTHLALQCPSQLMLQTPMVGLHNVSNMLAAVATGLALGLDPAAIRKGLEGVQGVPGRLERVEPPDWPFSVFVDYAHTDDALRNVLNAVRSITAGRVICVFGCGGDRDRTKRPRMAAAAAELADRIFVTSDNPRKEDPLAIIDDIVAGLTSSVMDRVTVEPERAAAIEAAVWAAQRGDTVLIAGKGHEKYQLVGDRVLSFDDAAVARGCLEESGFALIKEEIT